MDKTIYDISQYDDQELYRMLDLDHPTDRELEMKIIVLLQKYQDMDNPMGRQMYSFFNDIYHHFFEDDVDETEADAEVEEEVVEGFENPTTTPPIIQTSGNWTGAELDILPDSEVSRGTAITAGPSQKAGVASENTVKVGINTNFGSSLQNKQIGYQKSLDYTKGSLNPIIKETIQRVISIDSQFRDVNVYPYSTDFTFNLSDTLQDVVSLKLYSVQIPFTWYTVSNAYGSNFMFLNGNSPGIMDTGNYNISINIPSGNYQAKELTSALSDAFKASTMAYPDIYFGPTSEITYNPVNSRAKITLDMQQIYNESYYYVDFPVYNPKTIDLEFIHFSSTPYMKFQCLHPDFTNVLNDISLVVPPPVADSSNIQNLNVTSYGYNVSSFISTITTVFNTSYLTIHNSVFNFSSSTIKRDISQNIMLNYEFNYTIPAYYYSKLLNIIKSNFQFEFVSYTDNSYNNTNLIKKWSGTAWNTIFETPNPTNDSVFFTANSDKIIQSIPITSSRINISSTNSTGLKLLRSDNEGLNIINQLNTSWYDTCHNCFVDQSFNNVTVPNRYFYDVHSLVIRIIPIGMENEKVQPVKIAVILDGSELDPNNINSGIAIEPSSLTNLLNKTLTNNAKQLAINYRIYIKPNPFTYTPPYISFDASSISQILTEKDYKISFYDTNGYKEDGSNVWKNIQNVWSNYLSIPDESYVLSVSNQIHGSSPFVDEAPEPTRKIFPNLDNYSLQSFLGYWVDTDSNSITAQHFSYNIATWTSNTFSGFVYNSNLKFPYIDVSSTYLNGSISIPIMMDISSIYINGSRAMDISSTYLNRSTIPIMMDISSIYVNGSSMMDISSIYINGSNVLDISSIYLNRSSITDISSIYWNGSTSTVMDISSIYFNGSNVLNISNIYFNGSKSLAKDISNIYLKRPGVWDISSININSSKSIPILMDISSIYVNGSSAIDISSIYLNRSSITDISSIYWNGSKSIVMDISSVYVNGSNVLNISNIYVNGSKSFAKDISNIYLKRPGDWDISSININNSRSIVLDTYSTYLNGSNVFNVYLYQSTITDTFTTTDYSSTSSMIDSSYSITYSGLSNKQSVFTFQQIIDSINASFQSYGVFTKDTGVHIIDSSSGVVMTNPSLIEDNVTYYYQFKIQFDRKKIKPKTNMKTYMEIHDSATWLTYFNFNIPVTYASNKIEFSEIVSKQKVLANTSNISTYPYVYLRCITPGYSGFSYNDISFTIPSSPVNIGYTMSKYLSEILSSMTKPEWGLTGTADLGGPNSSFRMGININHIIPSTTNGQSNFSIDFSKSVLYQMNPSENWVIDSSNVTTKFNKLVFSQTYNVVQNESDLIQITVKGPYQGIGGAYQSDQINVFTTDFRIPAKVYTLKDLINTINTTVFGQNTVSDSSFILNTGINTPPNDLNIPNGRVNMYGSFMKENVNPTDITMNNIEFNFSIRSILSSNDYHLEFYDPFFYKQNPTFGPGLLNQTPYRGSDPGTTLQTHVYYDIYNTSLNYMNITGNNGNDALFQQGTWKDTSNSWYNYLYIPDSSYLLIKQPTVTASQNVKYTYIYGTKTITDQRLKLTTANNYLTLKPNYDSNGGVFVTNPSDYKGIHSNANDIVIKLDPDDLSLNAWHTSEEIVSGFNKQFAKDPRTNGSYMYIDKATHYTVIRLNVNKIFTAQDYSLVFYESSLFTHCSYGSNPSIQTTTQDTTLGWLLGFRNLPIYNLNSNWINEYNKYHNYAINYTLDICNNIVSIVGDTSVSITLYNYFLIILDDYTQSHLNDGLVTVNSSIADISLPSYANRNTYRCNADFSQNNSTKDLTYIGNNRDPTSNNNLTLKQLYSANQILNTQQNNNKTHQVNMGIYVQNIFGIIPVKTSGLINGQTYVEFGGTLQNQDRTYFGPVNIKRMAVRILTDKGNILDLNNANISFSLIAQQLYNPYARG
jgi:hypothetical protein